MSTVAVSMALDREQLILTHLAQVHLLAVRQHRKCPPKVLLEDLISVGTIGLIQAVDRYDPSRNLKLKTLAEYRIRGSMLDYLRKLDPLPRPVRRFVRQRDEAAAQLERQLGQRPDGTEIAEALGLSLEHYRRLEYTARAATTVSLEALPPGVI